MIALKNDRLIEEFVVVHPLYDEPEQKRSGAELGRMAMSKPVQISLLLLRGYLILMFMLLGFHILDLAGVFGHHIVH
jgi:hypothetical protein